VLCSSIIHDVSAFSSLPQQIGSKSLGSPAGTASESNGSIGEESASASLQRGEYLTTAANCGSCHTRQGGEPFSGGVPFETPYGAIFSSNITPDLATGIGKWSVNELMRAMHEGVAAGGYRLFPAFPYTHFTKVSNADVGSIYVYLMSLKAVKYSPPGNAFLFKQRWGLIIWNKTFFTEGRFVPDRSQSDEWNRGAYLVEALGHCGACHTPRDQFMAEIPSKAYTGGTLQDRVDHGMRVRRWSASNLTSAPQGLAVWSVNELATYLHTGVSPRAGSFGPMNEIILNSLSKMTSEDVHAMAVYLKSMPATGDSGESIPSDKIETGEPIYKERCEKCHGHSGRGGMFSGPPLAGNPVTQASDPASLINVILYGPDLPNHVSFGSWETMRAYGDVLSDEQVAAVCNYIRGSWGNHSLTTTAAEVTMQR
jgi:alcohol dehydrogenase (quinone), cytochrome c subunit